MSNNLLRLTTPSGKPVIVDGTGKQIKVIVQDGGNHHTLQFAGLGHSEDQGHFIRTRSGQVVQLKDEDAIAVAALVEARPKPKTPWVLYSVGGVLALLFIIGIANSGGSSSTSGSKATATAEAPPAVTEIGTGVPVGNAMIGITKVQVRDAVGDSFLREAAADGGVLVVLDIAIKNAGDKPLKSYDMPKLKLVDGAGTEYAADIGKSSSYATETHLDAKAFSDLNPDITVHDAEVFEVSKAKFDRSTWYAVTENGQKLALQ